MADTKSTRRNFIRGSALGLGGLTLTSPLTRTNKKHPLSVPQDKLSILCVGAHPGDPEFGCGGTLLKYSEAGHGVTVVYLTRGEASDPGRSFPEMAALRTREAEVSCRILKVKPIFAGQTDGNTEYTNKASEGISKVILAEKPDIVLTHWPLDTHKDHQVAGVLALNAWVRSGQQFELYFYEVNTGDESMLFQPTDYEDITTYRDVKRSALMAHKTQNPGEVYNRFFKTMEEFRGLEAGVTAAEAFIHMKSKAARRKTL